MKNKPQLKYFDVRLANSDTIIRTNVESDCASNAVSKLLDNYKAYFKNDLDIIKSVKELEKKPSIFE